MSKQTNAYEGFETFTNAFKMAFKMHAIIILSLITLHIIIFIGLTDFRQYENKAIINWYKVSLAAQMPIDLKVKFPLPNGEWITAIARAIYFEDELSTRMKKIQGGINSRLKKTALIYLLYPILIFYFHQRAKRQTAKKHIRGETLITPKQYQKKIKKNKEKTDLPLGQVTMPVDAETKHLIMVGKTGSGKTNAMNQVVERLKDRGERGIIYDSKGDFISNFYDPDKDIIFNPLDQRTVRWSIFNDIRLKTDIKAIANSQIPEPPHRENSFWTNTARGIFSGTIKYLNEKGSTKNSDIWDFLNQKDKHIGNALSSVGEISAKYLTKPDSDTAQSIISTLISYIEPYEYLADIDGDFSIIDWINNGEGFLFISSFSQIRDTLKPIISLFLDIMAMRLLARPENPREKTFFIIEELWSLQKLPSLLDLITQSRSKGGALFLSVQEVAQLDAIYGSNGRKTLFNNCGSQLVFGCSESDTAEYCSKLIGSEEAIESTKTYSLGVDKFKDGVNLSQSRRNKRIIMPSEIRALNDLESITKFNGYSPTRNSFAYKEYDSGQPSFIERGGLKLTRVLNDKEKKVADYG